MGSLCLLGFSLHEGICQKFRLMAPDYGFVERYPAGKEAVTGIGHEPWHFRYSGTAPRADHDGPGAGIGGVSGKMRQRQAYTGIDIFRWAAAFLIVAIHTSPLASFSETGDFVLTRVIARVAVPFFLMTSGFSCSAEAVGRPADFRPVDRGEEKLWRFLQKTAVIYGGGDPSVSAAEYLQRLFLRRRFAGENLKDLLFDGTMYHLWYLPASMLGAVIAWYARKRMGYPGGALLLTAVLLYHQVFRRQLLRPGGADSMASGMLRADVSGV